jgi:hypothetical protein
VVLAEGDDGVVPLEALLRGLREVEARRVVSATPARRVVVRRDRRGHLGDLDGMPAMPPGRAARPEDCVLSRARI